MSASQSRPRGRLLLVGLAAALALLAFAAAASARPLYFANFEVKSLSVIDSDTDEIVGPPIQLAGEGPNFVAITSDGKTAYVNDLFSGFLEKVDTTTNKVVGAPIAIGRRPEALTLSPDDSTLYAYINEPEGVPGRVVVVDTATDEITDSISVGESPVEGVETLDGKTLFIITFRSSDIEAIDTATDTVTETIPLPAQPGGSVEPSDLKLTPDGKTAIIPGFGADVVFEFNTETRELSAPIKVGHRAEFVAITPDGRTAYVTTGDDAKLWVIDVPTGTVVGEPIPMEQLPGELVMSPDGKRVYVENRHSVQVVDTATNQVVKTIKVSVRFPFGIAFVPNQGPVAAFSAHDTGASGKVTFDASESSDSDGSVVRYEWDFGDGTRATSTTPTLRHTYPHVAADYRVTLVVTDNEGCSKSYWTGAMFTCHSPGGGTRTETIHVKGPHGK